MPSRALLDRIAEAISRGDMHALKDLYAQDALICTAAERDVVSGRDELFADADVVLRTQLIGPLELIPLDETAGLMRATARSATADGRYGSATELVWLLTFKDGLVYRQRVLQSREEAVDLYARFGVGLGMRLMANSARIGR